MAVHAGSLWMEENWTRLPPGLWVATNAEGIIVEDRSLASVYNFLRRENYKLPDVTIVFVPVGIIQ